MRPVLLIHLPPEAQKAVVLVRHIRRHLRPKAHPDGFYADLAIEIRDSIPAGIVGCTICHRTIDEIFKMARDEGRHQGALRQ